MIERKEKMIVVLAVLVVMSCENKNTFEGQGEKTTKAPAESEEMVVSEKVDVDQNVSKQIGSEGCEQEGPPQLMGFLSFEKNGTLVERRVVSVN